MVRCAKLATAPAAAAASEEVQADVTVSSFSHTERETLDRCGLTGVCCVGCLDFFVTRA